MFIAVGGRLIYTVYEGGWTIDSEPIPLFCGMVRRPDAMTL